VTSGVNGDTEAVQLAELFRELTARLADQAAIAAMWQERARVLAEQLALSAPTSAVDASTAPETPGPAPGPLGRSQRVWGALAGGVAAGLLLVALVVLLAWRW
jgi:hypothetical protein